MPPDGTTAGLYERDFYAWALQQAEAIRAAHAARTEKGANDWRVDLDWENLAEEIESLGRNSRRELLSRIETVIEHLLKLEHSPTREPRVGWRDTVRRSRAEIVSILDDSPSLRPAVPELAVRAFSTAGRLVSASLEDHHERVAAAAVRQAVSPYTPDQILNDWWPDAPA